MYTLLYFHTPVIVASTPGNVFFLEDIVTAKKTLSSTFPVCWNLKNYKSVSTTKETFNCTKPCAACLYIKWINQSLNSNYVIVQVQNKWQKRVVFLLVAEWNLFSNCLKLPLQVSGTGWTSFLHFAYHSAQPAVYGIAFEEVTWEQLRYSVLFS